MMGRQVFRSVLATLAVLAIALAGVGGVSAAAKSGESPQTREHRVALVIGNAKYPSNALRNPVNDARAMARALRALGFDVIERTDVSQKDFNRSITQFRSKIGSDSVALFYYAGHGMQVRGNNYLIPVDAQISTEATVGSEAVNMDTVLQQLTEAGSRVNLVILDACRNNPYERRFRGGSGGLASMDAPKGTLIAYATAPGKVAMDGEGANGLYTSELLKAIRQPGWQVEEVFKEVRNQVNKGSGDSQTPWESSSLTGRFYFSAPVETKSAPVATPVVPVAPAASVDDMASDIEAWRGAQRLDTDEAYRAYLQQYPQGRFAGLAKAALSKLRQQQQEKVAQAAAAKAKPEPAPAKVAQSEPKTPSKDAAKQPDRLAMAKPTAGTPSAPPPAPATPVAPPVAPDPSSYRPTGRPTCKPRDDLASFFKDEALGVKLSSSLQFNKVLMREKILAKVSGGVATLTGTVSSDEHAMLAGRLAAEANGINCVNNLLQVGVAERETTTNPFGGR
jgi:uncharacterized caspase-like protein